MPNAYLIAGSVTDQSGNPLPGLVIKAFDVDLISEDDFLGQGETATDGSFTILTDRPSLSKTYWNRSQKAVRIWCSQFTINPVNCCTPPNAAAVQSVLKNTRSRLNDYLINRFLSDILGYRYQKSSKAVAISLLIFEINNLNQQSSNRVICNLQSTSYILRKVEATIPTSCVPIQLPRYGSSNGRPWSGSPNNHWDNRLYCLSIHPHGAAWFG